MRPPPLLVRNWPLAVGVVVHVAVQGAQVWSASRRTGGEFAYPLDDAYIHLAMARTLAEHGVFGVTPHAFAAASSSPLWLALLAAGMSVCGRAIWLPLGLASLAALAVLILVDRIAVRAGAPPPARLVLSLALVLLVPLPTLANTGMEHALHALLAVAFVDRVAAVAADPRRRAALRTVVLLAPCLAAVRLESAFLVGPAAVVLWRVVGLRQALAVGIAAAAPWLLLGGWAWAQGHFLLPNSIVMKSGATAIPGLRAADGGWGSGVLALAHHGHAGALFVALVVPLWLWRERRPSAARWTLAIAGGGLLLHAQLARFGWFFRYEAYLLVLGVAAAAAACPEIARSGRRQRVALAVLGAAALAAGSPRAVRALSDPPRACRHTFLQNVQVGRLLAAHGAGEAVAVNDIGAASFFGAARTVDLVGLAEVEVARARRAGTFDAEFVRRLTAARGVSLAVVYEDWFPEQLPAAWVRLARWTVPQAYWSPTVSWFATDPAHAARWREVLRGFTHALPPAVVVEFED